LAIHKVSSAKILVSTGDFGGGDSSGFQSEGTDLDLDVREVADAGGGSIYK
jgi:hypothetical protein